MGKGKKKKSVVTTGETVAPCPHVAIRKMGPRYLCEACGEEPFSATGPARSPAAPPEARPDAVKGIPAEEFANPPGLFEGLSLDMSPEQQEAAKRKFEEFTAKHKRANDAENALPGSDAEKMGRQFRQAGRLFFDLLGSD